MTRGRVVEEIKKELKLVEDHIDILVERLPRVDRKTPEEATLIRKIMDLRHERNSLRVLLQTMEVKS